MEDMLQWGLSWLQESRHSHMTSEVQVGLTLDQASPLQATFASVDATNPQSRVGMQGQYFNIIFRRSDLVEANIKIRRGLKIWDVSDNVYEVVVQDRMQMEFHDPLSLDVMVTAVLVSPASITPNPPYPHSNQEHE